MAPPRSTPSLAWLAISWLIVLAVGFSPTAKADDDASLELTYLANEGFLLRADGSAVLIDAFVTQPYSVYAAVPQPVFDQLLAGEPPFDTVTLALVSHPHRDHFQAAPAAEFLSQHPDVLLASSPQVVRAVELVMDDSEAAATIEAVWPEVGTVQRVERDGVAVDIFRLRHGSKSNYSVHNLGHVIHIGGRKVLHVGDAEMLAEHYQPFDLPSRDIDIALVPYWFYFYEGGVPIVEEHFQARVRVAVHIPPNELEEVTAALAESFPDVVVFGEPMETKGF